MKYKLPKNLSMKSKTLKEWGLWGDNTLSQDVLELRVRAYSAIGTTRG